ncbi:MAG: hypothetical protein OEX19_10380 [Gammaproteobacteria bacterium]|nr:hypothetical protein [Gammaproteobacteria bacterium]
MFKRITLTLLICFAWRVDAQDQIDEEAMFSDVDAVVMETKDIVNKGPVEEEKKSLGISGEATSVADYIRVFEDNGKLEGKQDFSNYILGNFLLDARLKKGTKGFANIQLMYDPEDVQRTDDFSVKEMFVDFNIRNKVYFRTGKQVLIWGRSYLWNPSDLINIEKNTFLTRIGAREGTYGLKMHIPFGTKYNIYGFVDTNRASEIGGAGKFEFIIGGTEMAFSAWYKRNYKPVGAYDFSTRISGIDIRGEAALSYKDNTNRIRVNNGLLEQYTDADKWVPKASINFGRAFDYGDEIDKFMLNLELFYNGAGYADNLFADQNEYAFDAPIDVYEGSGQMSTYSAGTKRDYLLYNNLYDINHLSRYYAVFFATVNKFIRSELTLTMNLISNISDESYILATGLNYLDINDLKFGLQFYFNLGEKDSEYTALGRGIQTQFTAGILF